MKRLLVFALVPVITALGLSGSGGVASAHMLPGSPHVGYYTGTTTRLEKWYDETGLSSWITPEGQWASHYLDFYTLYHTAGHKVPYVDYHTSGGTPGCANQYRSFDVCVGTFSSSYAALASWSVDASSHLAYGNIKVRNDGLYTTAQRESLMCQEASHLLGLDHNPNTASCMYFQVQASAPQNYDAHDTNTLLTFYDGHLP